MGLVDNGCVHHIRHGRSIDLAHGVQAAASTIQNAGMSHISNAESGLDEAPLRSTLNGGVRARRTRRVRRDTPRQAGVVQPEGVWKPRNSKGR